MKTSIGHLVVQIDQENAKFYKDLLAFLGWSSIHDDESVFGVSDGSASSVWFECKANGAQNDRDGAGLNHFAFSAGNGADVDAAATYVKGNGVELLFGTPCNRPEYARSENDLYYSVMFESPDRILFEVVYIGPK